MSDTTEKQLPEGWEYAPLLSLSSLIRGVSYKRGEALEAPQKGYVPLLRAGNLQDDIVLEDLRYVPENRVSPDQYLKIGDVVLAMSSGSKSVVGKAACFNYDGLYTFGAFCSILMPPSKVCNW